MFQLSMSFKDEMPPPFTDPQTLKDYRFLQKSAASIGNQVNTTRTNQNPAKGEDAEQPSIPSRLPTPDKAKIMELADSLGKQKLRKYQQLLADITLRCREQEVLDMSSTITKKCRLEKYEDRVTTKEATLYNTTSMMKKTTNPKGELEGGGESHTDEVISPRLTFEKSRTFFPVRKVRHSPVKECSLQGFPPRLEISYRKGVMPSALYNRKNLSKTHRINGLIQQELYQPRAEQLAPLVLPSIKHVSFQSDRNSVDSYVYTKKMNLGCRGKGGLETMSLPPRASPSRLQPGQALNWTSVSQPGTEPSTTNVINVNADGAKLKPQRFTQLVFQP